MIKLTIIEKIQKLTWFNLIELLQDILPNLNKRIVNLEEKTENNIPVNPGITEAPVDGIQYGRQDGEWTEITGGGGSQDLQQVLDTGNISEDTPIIIQDTDEGHQVQIGGRYINLTYPASSLEDTRYGMRDITVKDEDGSSNGGITFGIGNFLFPNKDKNTNYTVATLDDITGITEDSVKIQSTMYQKSYFTNFNDFNISGFTPTLNLNSIQFTGGVGDFNQYMIIKDTINTDENWEFKVISKVGTNANNSTGIGVGKRSLTVGNSLVLQVSYGQNKIIFWNSATFTLIKSVDIPTIQVGDILELKLVQKGTEFIGYYKNTTTFIEQIIKIESNLGVVKNFKTPNTGEFVLYNLGGDSLIKELDIKSTTPYNADVICIGDSKTYGYSATTKGLRFSSLLNNLGTVYTYAGDGDSTVQIRQSIDKVAKITPKYAILCIGRNDLALGVNPATWKANYQFIVDSLEAVNTTVIHLFGIDETLQNQTELWTWIDTTYSINKINVLSGWNNSTMLSTDTVHQNELGHRYIAQSIINSGLIPLSNNFIPNYFEPVIKESNIIGINTNKFIPISIEGAFVDSKFYEFNSDTYVFGHNNTVDYGSEYRVLAIENNNSIAGLISLGATSTNRKGYMSANTEGIMHIGTYQNGILRNAITINPEGAVIINDGLNSDNLSVKFSVESTNKGSIHSPVMTNAQRLSIPSPALGLHVYQSDDVEGVYVYKSTGWSFAYSNNPTDQIHIISTGNFNVPDGGKTRMITLLQDANQDIVLPSISDCIGCILFITNESSDGTSIKTVKSNLGANDLWDGGSVVNNKVLNYGMSLRFFNDGRSFKIVG